MYKLMSSRFQISLLTLFGSAIQIANHTLQGRGLLARYIATDGPVRPVSSAVISICDRELLRA